MPFTFLSISGLVFVASMVLYDQWLTGDRRGKSRQYKRTRWTGMWIGLAVSATLILLFVLTN